MMNLLPKKNIWFVICLLGVFVDELKRQKYDLTANQNCHSPKQKYFPGNYTTCANIFSVFWGLILVISGE